MLTLFSDSCMCEEKTHGLHMLSSHRVSWNLENFLKSAPLKYVVKDAYYWLTMLCVDDDKGVLKHSVYYLQQERIRTGD